MRNKARMLMVVAVCLLAIGFALVTATLTMTGNVTVESNANDFDVVFTGAVVDGDDKSNEVIIDNAKKISFSSKQLVKPNIDKSTLEYEVTNKSKNYDATASVSCEFKTEVDYLEISQDKTSFDIQAGNKVTGNVEVLLTGDVDTIHYVDLECTLNVNAVEKTELGEEPIIDKYRLSATLYDENDEVVGNKYLAVYSDEKKVVKTKANGSFKVNMLERGVHEIYYMGDINPTELSDEEIEEQKIGLLTISTNYEGDKQLSNGFKIKNVRFNVSAGEGENFAEFLMEKSEDDDSIIAQTHGSTSQTGNNALIDYRYIGRNPNNYVKIDNVLYRIIGVFNMPKINDNDGVLTASTTNYEWRVKLLKADEYTTNGIAIEESYYSKSGYGYYWTGLENTGTRNDYSKSTLFVGENSVLNVAYWNSLAQTTKNLIGPSIWYLGGAEGIDKAEHFYTSERGTTTYDSSYLKNTINNIGLMYASDYGFSTSCGSTSRDTCLNRNMSTWGTSDDCINNSWIYYDNQHQQWTISSLSNKYHINVIGYDGSLRSNAGNVNFGVRPSFYLKTEVNVDSAHDGSKTDPYELIIKNN